MDGGGAAVATIRNGWRDFWNGKHAIYVSARHKTLHYQLVAREILALIPSPAATVLDYGCGEALSAQDVARACRRLILCDAAPSVRARIAERMAGWRGVSVSAPEELDDVIPDGGADLIVVNSLLQYLTGPEFAEAAALWRRKIAPGGLLVVADVVPPETSPWRDADALLDFASKGGFLGAALFGLARTFFSDYRRLRGELGLSTYDEFEMIALLAKAGFDAARQPRNLGHNPHRMTFHARPRPEETV